MSDNKKYYYLKLKENFFDEPALELLESMENGYIYSNILLKLYLKSLRNEGRLAYNDRIPYNSKVIAQMTKHNIDVVEKAIRTFKELDLIEILDNGAIYMLDIQNFIGKSTTEADRIRNYRNRINEEKCTLKLSDSKVEVTNDVTNVQSDSVQMYDKSTPEYRDKSIEFIDKSKEIYNSHPTPPYEQIVNLYNTICVSLPKVVDITDARKTTLRAWWKSKKDISLDYFENFFNKVEASDFLCGRTKNLFACGFDWIIAPKNRQKIIEGSYDNRTGNSSRDTIIKWAEG